MQPQYFLNDDPEQRADMNEIKRAVRVLFDPESVIELRVLKANSDGKPYGTVSGYFDGKHREELAEAAAYWSGRAPGVYFTLNPVRPDLLARASNRAKTWARETASDSQIVSRRWLLIDFDPSRPSGISATEAEKAFALARAQQSQAWLAEQGWPAPLLADSGNGAHLLYRVDLPNDPPATALVKAVLKALAERWGDSAVMVDQSVFNAARICKLYGTLSAKGDSTSDRPHRIARLVDIPASINPVPRALLEALGSEGQRVSTAVSSDFQWPSAKFDIEAWLDKHGFQVTKTKAYAAGGSSGKLYELSRCPWRPAETDGGACVIQWEDGTIIAKCHHSKCSERGWSDLQSLVENATNGSMPAKANGSRWAPIEAPDDPHRLARIVLDRMFRTPAGLTIAYWRNQWQHWNGQIWLSIGQHELETKVSLAIKGEFDALSIKAQEMGLDKRTALKVTQNLVRNVIQALRGFSLIDNTLEQPCWLTEGQSWDARDVLAASNGLVHLPSLVTGDHYLKEHTRDFFASMAVDYEVQRNDGQIREWSAFLNSIWGNDRESIELLQEWFGYCLTADLRQQKMLLLLGPPRSGKGTITRVLTRLIGPPNVVNPTLASLAQNFGLQPWLSKSLAIFTDARLDARSSGSIITERLLSISGCDSLTIDVKFGMPVTTALQTKIMLATNELFQLRDSSGALSNRFVIIRLTNSFLGIEDLDLKEKLTNEMSGIFLWAVEGWRRLREKGKLIEPKSSRTLRQSLERLSSPVAAFLEECCLIAPTASVQGKQLYAKYLKWLKRYGHTYEPTAEIFGRDLAAAVPGLERIQERISDKRCRVYRGVALRQQVNRSVT
jgi:putative DNA primase/helicase